MPKKLLKKVIPMRKEMIVLALMNRSPSNMSCRGLPRPPLGICGTLRNSMTMAMMAMIEMEMTFTSDKMVFKGKIMGQPKSDEMSYKITSQTGNKMVLETTDQDGKKQTLNAEIKGDLLFLSKGDTEKFALRRK